MLKRITKETVTKNIIKQIRAMIQSGEFQPGKKIPSERQLTEAFSVSRIAVREAIKSLEANGLVEVRPGEGTFVKTPTSFDLIDPLTKTLVAKYAFKDLIEVRRIVEVEIAGLAAERALEEDIAKIKEALEMMKLDIEKKTSHIESDFMFHDAIAKSSDNKLLARMMLTARDLMHEAINLSTKIDGTDLRAYEGHCKVYEMIVEQNSNGARKAMLDHLRQVEEDLLEAQRLFIDKSIEQPEIGV